MAKDILLICFLFCLFICLYLLRVSCLFYFTVFQKESHFFFLFFILLQPPSQTTITTVITSEQRQQFLHRFFRSLGISVYLSFIKYSCCLFLVSSFYNTFLFCMRVYVFFFLLYCSVSLWYFVGIYGLLSNCFTSLTEHTISSSCLFSFSCLFCILRV